MSIAVQVRDNAQAFLDTIERMPAEQKAKRPTAQYGEQYNKLLELAKEVAPSVDPRLWPPSVETYHDLARGMTTKAHYSEIETYVRQIIAHLPSGRQYA